MSEIAMKAVIVVSLFVAGVDAGVAIVTGHRASTVLVFTGLGLAAFAWVVLKAKGTPEQ